MLWDFLITVKCSFQRKEVAIAMRKIAKKQRNLGIVEGWVSVVLNTLLFGLKIWAGTLIGSVAMVADAWHTLSDTLTSLVVIIGFWIAGKPADKEHPFGHGRAENIAAIIIGVLLAIVGVNFFKESILRLVHYQAVQFSLWGIIIFSISILAKEGLARYAFSIGKKIDSRSVSADGWHHRSDAIASALIVVGAIFGNQFWWIDGVLGVGVSILILYAAFDILKGTISGLLGEAPDDATEEKISKAISEHEPAVSDIHHMHMHKYGDATELTVHIRLKPDMDISQAHEITRSIEQLLEDKFSVTATVHVEPIGEDEVDVEPRSTVKH